MSLALGAPVVTAGSPSRLSDILSQMRSTRRSKVCFTLMLSLALVSKNSKPGKSSDVRHRNIGNLHINCCPILAPEPRAAAAERRKRFLLCHLEKTKTFLCSCGGCNILTTYPTVPPAACRYPLTPLSPHPCRTCSQPEPPEHYPMNTFLSGSTCAETSNHQRLSKMDSRKLFRPFIVSFVLEEEEQEG